MYRRTFVATVACGLTALGGCIAPESGRPAHTVSVYLLDREATRDVTVTVTGADDEVLFDRAYALSDDNEAAEDATFPATTDPATVGVSVDGTSFERQWPEPPVTTCDGGNEIGIEVYVRGPPGDEPSVRLEPNCQYVTASG